MSFSVSRRKNNLGFQPQPFYNHTFQGSFSPKFSFYPNQTENWILISVFCSAKAGGKICKRTSELIKILLYDPPVNFHLESILHFFTLCSILLLSIKTQARKRKMYSEGISQVSLTGHPGR
jgi:hypothetical protein